LGAVLESFNLERAHIIGHSIAGAAITHFATQHPERVIKLVYLDATFDYGTPEENVVDELAVPRPRPERPFATPAEAEEWTKRFVYGTWSNALSADAEAFRSVPPADAAKRAKAQASLLEDATAHPKQYHRLTAPALSIWAEKTLATQYFWIERQNADLVRRAEEHLLAWRKWETEGVKRFRRDALKSEVVAFPAHHWLFITELDRTASAIREFLK
jgi:pimeloyl-ACP methyl ester carboxylesterase